MPDTFIVACSLALLASLTMFIGSLKLASYRLAAISLTVALVVALCMLLAIATASNQPL